jgi:hypothetical protein
MDTTAKSQIIEVVLGCKRILDPTVSDVSHIVVFYICSILYKVFFHKK